jgi:hypothetical protein
LIRFANELIRKSPVGSTSSAINKTSASQTSEKDRITHKRKIDEVEQRVEQKDQRKEVSIDLEISEAPLIEEEETEQRKLQASPKSKEPTRGKQTQPPPSSSVSSITATRTTVTATQQIESQRTETTLDTLGSCFSLARFRFHEVCVHHFPLFCTFFV